MKKHAYLILAHNNFNILKKLIALLDDRRNDIYIHIDSKVSDFDFAHFSKIVNYSKLHFIANRTDVKWGHVSFVEAEFNLFKAAFHSNESYQYYHLISGVDLPIKTQNYIHSFFEKHERKEFIGFSTDSYNELNYKVTKIHIGTPFFKVKNHLLRKIIFFFDKFFTQLQYVFSYNHVQINETYKLAKGCNWVSLTGDFVGYLLKKEPECLRNFKFSICPDEIFIHTVLINSPYQNNVFLYNDEYDSCMRLIDWQKGHPYIFKSSDFDEIMSSNKLFARKFDENNMEIVDRVFDILNKKSQNESLICN